ncbi:unnamed protein product [Fusarium graminearum]|uniref:Uncharacterized protein n=1 Tax=Gibberella zeae TaxID=5518 RepID=A0A4E9EBN8_GIBZA|nr:unnamed protein product [Fusarium graminearum]CAG1987359.1 unnamed protein product [Fusarium graminearum]
MVQRGLEAQKLGRVAGENSRAALKIGDNRPAEITILAMDASRLFPLGVLRTLDDNTTIDGDAGQYDRTGDPVRARASAIVKAQCSRSLVNVSQTKIVSTDNDISSAQSCPFVVVIVYLLTENAILKY